MIQLNTHCFNAMFVFFGLQPGILRSARPDCRPSERATDTVTVDLSRLSVEANSNGDFSHKVPHQMASTTMSWIDVCISESF